MKLSNAQTKLAANWVMVELSAFLNKDNLEISQSKVSALQLAELLKKIEDGTISGKIAKDVFELMWQTGDHAEKIISEKGLVQVSDDTVINQLIEDVFTSSPQQLQDYLSGKDKLFGYFVGQVMKNSGGKVNPAQLNQLLQQKFSQLKK